MTPSQRSHWRSHVGFVWAAAGSAVGLGNIWRFPYLAGENGGSIFIFVYLGCVLLLGLPIMIAEVMLGKITQRNPVGAFRQLAGKHSPWQLVGFMGVLAAFVILPFYSVVAGWCLDFIYKAATGVFQPGHTMEEVIGIFKELTASPRQQIFFHGIFILLTVGIVVLGVQKGLERCNEILMPALILILLGLIVFAFRQPNSGDGLQFMLRPDPAKLTANSVLAAMGQCFFSLSLGMGAMLTYGSYLRREDRVPSTSAWVVVMDTCIALLAGFVVFPIVFAFGQQPAQGPGLVFVTLPAAFLQMAGGTWMALAFFILLLFAALTSAISLLEVITAYFIDEFDMPRKLAAWMFGSICFLMGAGAAYSSGYFDFLDTLASHYLLPFGALLISWYVGWRLPKTISLNEFSSSKIRFLYMPWVWIVRLIAPILVVAVFLNSLGVFKKLLG
jgi:NSS family neurotransmitter:Na+ symporter